MKKIFLATLIVICIVSSFAITTLAAETPQITFKDVTASDANTLSGESKIEISLTGVTENLSNIQLYLDFESSDMTYKSIEWGDAIKTLLKTSPNMAITPNIALSNENKQVHFALFIINGTFSASTETPICIITFSGSPNDSVKLMLNQLDNSYVLKQGIEGNIGDKINFTKTAQSENIKASSKENIGVALKVKLSMTDVDDFSAPATSASGIDSGIYLTLTNKETGSTIYSVLDNRKIQDGGNRDTTVSTPTFVFDIPKIVQGNYSIQLTGEGYIPCVAEQNITANATVSIDNTKFKVGDINGDSKIDLKDYNIIMSELKNGNIGVISRRMDFNRDGKVDRSDIINFTKSLSREVQN